MDRGLGNDKFELAIGIRLREPSQKLKGIGETGRDRLSPKLGKEPIVMASAAANSLTPGAEGDAGDEY